MHQLFGQRPAALVLALFPIARHEPSAMLIYRSLDPTLQGVGVTARSGQRSATWSTSPSCHFGGGGKSSARASLRTAGQEVYFSPERVFIMRGW